MLLANRPDVKQAEFNLINAFELTNAAKAQFILVLESQEVLEYNR